MTSLIDSVQSAIGCLCYYVSNRGVMDLYAQYEIYTMQRKISRMHT